MNNLRMAYITRDALTLGIRHREISVRDGGTSARTTWGDVLYPGEWHDTREEAVKTAEAMRRDEIACHELKINLLKGIKF